MATINASRQFQELTAGQPVLTGTVTAINSNGTSTLTMIGGGVLVANGQDVSVGNVALVKNQVIIGEASSLPAYNLEV